RVCDRTPPHRCRPVLCAGASGIPGHPRGLDAAQIGVGPGPGRVGGRGRADDGEPAVVLAHPVPARRRPTGGDRPNPARPPAGAGRGRTASGDPACPRGVPDPADLQRVGHGGGRKRGIRRGDQGRGAGERPAGRRRGTVRCREAGHVGSGGQRGADAARDAGRAHHHLHAHGHDPAANWAIAVAWPQGGDDRGGLVRVGQEQRPLCPRPGRGAVGSACRRDNRGPGGINDVPETITITDNRTGDSIEIPIVNGGISASEWSKLLSGIWFYDPGFMATAACESAITYLDGEVGILRYRGYPIEELAESSTFLEVAYLLLHGQRANASEFESWQRDITYHTFIHESARKRFLEGFHSDAHPMRMLV